jgi:hypothetical protein
LFTLSFRAKPGIFVLGFTQNTVSCHAEHSEASWFLGLMKNFCQCPLKSSHFGFTASISAIFFALPRTLSVLRDEWRLAHTGIFRNRRADQFDRALCSQFSLGLK